jgi:myosin-5
MNKVKQEVPLWAKPGKKIWYEIREPLDIEVDEYREAEVETCNYEKRELTIRDLKQDKVLEARGDRIHEREDKHNIVNNLSDIPTLNDAELMKHLEVRYKNQLIHCFCGLTLIVINPYKLIDHETSPLTMERILKSLHDHKLAECFPHIWTISAYAWNNLFTMGLNQAVCISGESGAGKTESTKRCLEFITQMKGTGTSVIAQPIEKKILSCNPILESFGNAKTIRNDNSSRFGKYTTLFVDKNKRSVKGAAVENYLLEKSRVTTIGEKERNYHIFYAMCRFMPKNMQAKYFLINNNGACDMKVFNYLNQSVIYEDPKVNDLEFWTDVSASLDTLRFSEGQKDAMWRILSAVLYFGNVKVDESTFSEGAKPCRIIRDESWERVLKNLDLADKDKEDFLEEALSCKELKIGGNVTRSPLKPSQVKNNIDSIARELYNRMFNWIVKKVNQNLLPANPKNPAFQTIGVLDIFGFEIFTKNSIEQLFINFANERLQGLYIDYIFKNECRIFEEEGLGEFTSNIVYKDNKPLLLCLDNPRTPPGIFDLIDGTCALNKNDEFLHGDIMKNHKSSGVIIFPKVVRGLVFIVKHTARDVEYVTDNFVEKNKDELSLFLQNAVEKGLPDVVRVFHNLLEGEAKSEEEVKKNPKEKYLGYKFRKNMNDLIDALAACYCHFVRCIKPNEKKMVDCWDEKLALTQIRYMGLLDSLKIRKLSYPFRWTYDKFYQVFQDLDMSPNGAARFTELARKQTSFRDLDSDLLKHCGVPHSDKDLLYGKTRIFLNEKFKIELEKALYVKQKVKKEALALIGECFLNYQAKREILTFFVNYGRSIAIARDLIKSWTAKIESMEYKSFKKVVRRLQGNFRLMQRRREMRLGKANMTLVVKRLVLQNLSKKLNFVYYYRNKVAVLQALIERKIKDSKNRIVSEFVSHVFDISWRQITKTLQDRAVEDLQRSVRGWLVRKAHQSVVNEFSAKISESKEYNAAANIQRIVRGFLVRKRMYMLNKAARKIQGMVKMRWLRAYFKLIQRAAKVIGRFLRKMYIRKCQHKQHMHNFTQLYQNYTERVFALENGLLFAEDFGTGSDFQSGPFQPPKADQASKSVNFKGFVPPAKDIELNKNAKLMSLLVDLNVNVDTSSIYQNSWAAEFASFIKQTHEKGARMLHLEVGESFTVGVTDDKEVMTWGCNDFGQCGRDLSSSDFSVSVGSVRMLSELSPRIVSAGKETSLIVDEFGRVHMWGKNVDGQFGIPKTKEDKSTHEVTSIKGQAQSAVTKEGVSYAVTTDGRVYQWPRDKQSRVEEEGDSLNPFKPYEVAFGNNVKVQNVDAGTDFAAFLTTSGLVYAMGQNSFGELGLGDTKKRARPTLVTWFTDQNEKIVEVSCGHKHVLAQSSVGKVFAWGLNHNWQLGQGDNGNRSTPVRFAIADYESLRVKPRNVQAGFNNSFVLMSDRVLYYAGHVSSSVQKTAKVPTRFQFEDKYFKNKQFDQFVPVRVFVKWSKTLSVTYVVYADLRQDNSQSLISLFNEKFVAKVLGEWRTADKQLLPPQEEILQKSINLKYLQKPMKAKGETAKGERTANVQTIGKGQKTEEGVDRKEGGNQGFGYEQNNVRKQQGDQVLGEGGKQSGLAKGQKGIKAQVAMESIPEDAKRSKSPMTGSKNQIKSGKDQLLQADVIVSRQNDNLIIKETNAKKNALNLEPIPKVKDEKDKLLESMLSMMKKKGDDGVKKLDKSLVKLGKK